MGITGVEGGPVTEIGKTRYTASGGVCGRGAGSYATDGGRLYYRRVSGVCGFADRIRWVSRSGSGYIAHGRGTHACAPKPPRTGGRNPRPGHAGESLVGPRAIRDPEVSSPLIPE